MGDDDPKQAERVKLVEALEAARAVRQQVQAQLDLARQEEEEAFDALAAAVLQGDVGGWMEDRRDGSLIPFMWVETQVGFSYSLLH